MSFFPSLEGTAVAASPRNHEIRYHRERVVAESTGDDDDDEEEEDSSQQRFTQRKKKYPWSKDKRIIRRQGSRRIVDHQDDNEAIESNAVASSSSSLLLLLPPKDPIHVSSSTGQEESHSSSPATPQEVASKEIGVVDLVDHRRKRTKEADRQRDFDQQSQEIIYSGSESSPQRHYYLHDDCLEHLKQIVASDDDETENGDHVLVPFVNSSEDSSSPVPIVHDDDDNDDAVVFYSARTLTTSSAHSAAEYQDAYDYSDDVQYLQSATLSGGTFSALATDATATQNEVMDRIMVFPDIDAVQVTARNMAMEHRIFMKALLDLLDQRERYALDADMNDKETFKSGVLRKASHLVRGIWKVKYVEVRRGVFSYYEDEASKDSEEGTLVRKNIALHADTCKCRAVKVHQNVLSASPSGAIFELKVEGSPKRLWMANSREERQAWIHAIHGATLGKSVTRGDSDINHAGKSGNISADSPYKHDLELYVRIQRDIQFASSKQHYVGALSDFVGTKLSVPVQWIRHQMGGGSVENPSKAFHEEAVSRGVNQLWKDLLRDSVRVDDELFLGGSGHAPERIIAALMRRIMSYDKSSPLCANASEAQKHKYYINESQALSYARDILLAGNRTRSGGDSYFCVNTLCKNSQMTVTVPSSLEAEPWAIDISHNQPEKRGNGDTYYNMSELSGWLRTRRKPSKPWKKRYFVLSEGTLSYFEKALPRPRGLRGQITVSEATVIVAEAQEPDIKRKGSSPSELEPDGTSTQFVVSIVGKDGRLDLQILLQDLKEFILWVHSLEAYSVDDETWQSNHTATKVKGMFQKLRDEISGTQEPLGDFVLGHKSLKDSAAELGLDSDEVSNVIARECNSGANGRATVTVSVEASTNYKICTLDPQGDEAEDTWATIRAVFLQSFRLSGGPNGRIIRGEEVVEIHVMDCSHTKDSELLYDEDRVVTPKARLRPSDRLKAGIRSAKRSTVRRAVSS